MPTATTPRPTGSFGTTKKKILGVTARARLMYAAFVAAGAAFGASPITMAAFLALVQALEDAQNGALTRAKGLAALRNSKRDALWTAMEILRAFVQGIADTHTATDAITVIESAGLLVAKTRAAGKELLKAKLTSMPGTVHLEANAAMLRGKTSKHTTFNWQASSDGKSWSSAPSTPYARTDIPNLALMTTWWFRVSATVGTVTGEWSQPVSLLVH